MITKQITSFFSSTHRTLSVCIFDFCILRPSKFSSMGSPPLHYILVCKILTYQGDNFKLVKTDILFLRKTCELLIYHLFCSQFDTNLAPIPWTNVLAKHFKI